jgi:hypothetical protein
MNTHKVNRESLWPLVLPVFLNLTLIAAAFGSPVPPPTFQGCTLDQGAWGAPPHGKNPGMILAANFAAAFPAGVVIGQNGSPFSLTFTSAKAIENFLPQGGKPGKLTVSAVNPASSAAGVLAGQVLALTLNVGIYGFGGETVSAPGTPFDGKTVSQVLSVANAVLGGGPLPSGVNYGSLNDLLNGLNSSFEASCAGRFPPSISSADHATFVAAIANSFTIDAIGFPTPAISATGTLPNNVSLVDLGNGTATLSGTPPTSATGSYPITVKAANGVAPDAIQSFTLTVTPGNVAPSITSSNGATFSETVNNSFAVTTTGFPTPAITKTGMLPNSVTFVDNGNGTATLSGIPASGTASTYPLTIKAANGVAPDATQSFTLVVNPAGVCRTFKNFDLTVALNTVLAIDIPDIFGTISQTLCTSQVNDFINTNIVTQVAVSLVGPAAVTNAIVSIILTGP